MSQQQHSSLLPAALAAGQLTLLGPLAVWADNRASFAGFTPLAVLTLGLAFAALAVLLSLPARLLPQHSERISALLYAATLLMWGQSFVSGRLLTGVNLAGSVSSARATAELVGWLLVLALAVWLAARLESPLRRVALLAVLVQVLSVGWTLVGASAERRGLGSDRPADMAQLAQLSTERNIIVLVLDGMHRDYAAQVLRNDPELAARFNGFRVYTDHLATFPTTRFSIPAMLSGRNYDNTEPAERFIETTLTEGDSAPKYLREAGWHVGLATTIRATLVAPADQRLAVEAYVRKQRSARALGLELLDLSAFRHAPAPVGLWVYNDDRWRLQQLADATRKNYHAVRSQDFVADFVAGLETTRDSPAFRFIHIGGAHPPVVVDADCSFIGVQDLEPAAYGAQVSCALSQAATILDRLRQLDIYDNTAFIIASDHGVDVKGDPASEADPFAWVLDHAAAALMVKPFAATGALVFDPAPTSNQDLPEIVRRLTEPATGDDFLPPAVTPERQRRFNFHAWQNNDWRKSYLTALHHFDVAPGAGEKSAWAYAGTTPSPDLAEQEQERLRQDAATYFPSGKGRGESAGKSP